jgi:hypothetical protein
MRKRNRFFFYSIIHSRYPHILIHVFPHRYDIYVDTLYSVEEVRFMGILIEHKPVVGKNPPPKLPFNEEAHVLERSGFSVTNVNLSKDRKTAKFIVDKNMHSLADLKRAASEIPGLNPNFKMQADGTVELTVERKK